MSDIKVIEGLSWWEVARQVDEEGKRFAFKCQGEWTAAIVHKESNVLAYLELKRQVAIIDDTKPEIDWDGFDWDFFNQYEGVKMVMSGGNNPYIMATNKDIAEFVGQLAPSPFYYWPGGKQPVPDNVEVEVEDVFEDDAENVNSERQTLAARGVRWNSDRLVSFRLTGKVL
jgi:hypothetical protein